MNRASSAIELMNSLDSFGPPHGIFALDIESLNHKIPKGALGVGGHLRKMKGCGCGADRRPRQRGKSRP